MGVINKITMVYDKNSRDKDGIRVLGDFFVIKNKENCRMIINEKIYRICGYINYDEYGIKKDDKSLTIILTGINDCIDTSSMFWGCSSLQSLPDISKWDTKNVTSMSSMFYGCNSL